MKDDLFEAVLSAASADAALTEAATEVVLAALCGPAELDDHLGLGSAPDSPQLNEAAPPASTEPVEATPAPLIPAQRGAQPGASADQRSYLHRILVEGFRGIGAASTLTLKPRPGVVVVAGRNGSGKSSFAEAAEVVLTQQSFRGRDSRPTVFRQTWRNLHRTEATRVEVGLSTPTGPLTVKADWPADGELTGARFRTQRLGARELAGLDDLGWGEQIDLHRPFLSYEELGALLEPKDLYDALSKVLGLERLSEAKKLLDQAVRVLKEPKDRATKQKSQLLTLLTEHPDERASQVQSQLRKRQPDLDLLAGFLDSTPDDGASGLRALVDLSLPEPAALDSARVRVQQATERVDELRRTVDLSAIAASDLLSRAVHYYEEHGDGPCPVCHTGRLDTDWLADSREALLSRSTAEAELSQAEQTLTRTRAELAAQVPVTWLNLLDGAATELDPTSIEAARAALTAWRAHLSSPASTPTLPDEAAVLELCRAWTVLQTEARQQVAGRREAWQPVAEQLAGWLGTTRQVIARKPNLDAATAAKTWLADHEATLRNERLEPLADRAREIWAQLRQESNVDLGAITLERVGQRRSVEFRATVDGEDTGALAVMSQGELHALALSVFLPRATRPDSPFGFLVIDDPVQAMDPAKVDGLARVLEEVGRHRQVVVFTHDDRLPEAVRRLGIDADILQVNRDLGSKVTVSALSDPIERSLSDARAVAQDRALAGSQAQGKAVALLCREAFEAACRDIFFTTQFQQGVSRVAAEHRWSEHQTSSQRLRLALHGEIQSSADPWLQAKPYRHKALGVCTSAVHNELFNALNAIDDVQRAIYDLRSSHG